jgi:hypothetical protein
MESLDNQEERYPNSKYYFQSLEDKKFGKVRSMPFDPRFPNQNQSR